MTQKHQIQLFEEKKVRTVWDDRQEKFRLKREANESVTNCNQLKLMSPKDGKSYKTDVADTQQLFRIIHRDHFCKSLWNSMTY